ncbi:MAG: hypothetical protein KAK00_00410 [Nanoarchaeota archaeon]|nr:hypothetical protein [Nanoarchaeota archaeon]
MEFQITKITKTDVESDDVNKDSTRFKIQMISKSKNDNPMTINIVEDLIDDNQPNYSSFSIGDLWSLELKSKQSKLS